MLLFWHTSNNACYFDLINRTFWFIYLRKCESDVTFDLLRQLSCRCQDESDYTLWYSWQRQVLFKSLKLWENGSCKGKSFSRTCLSSNKKIIVVLIALKDFFLNVSWVCKSFNSERFDYFGMKALEVCPSGFVVIHL